MTYSVDKNYLCSDWRFFKQCWAYSFQCICFFWQVNIELIHLSSGKHITTTTRSKFHKSHRLWIQLLRTPKRYANFGICMGLPWCFWIWCLVQLPTCICNYDDVLNLMTGIITRPVCICFSVHVHPESVLPLAWGDPGVTLLHANRHVELWLYPGGAVHGVPPVPRGERGGAAGLYHGGPGTPQWKRAGSGHQEAPLLWLVPLL